MLLNWGIAQKNGLHFYNLVFMLNQIQNDMPVEESIPHDYTYLRVRFYCWCMAVAQLVALINSLRANGPIHFNLSLTTWKRVTFLLLKDFKPRLKSIVPLFAISRLYKTAYKEFLYNIFYRITTK